MPTKIPGCHRLWPFQLLSGAAQTRATSVSEGFSEARTMRCFFISRCRPGCLGWWGPCDTFGNIVRGNSTIPRCTGGPRIRGSLWSDSFGQRALLARIIDSVCTNLFKDTLPLASNTHCDAQPRLHASYTRLFHFSRPAAGILLDFDRQTLSRYHLF